MYVCMYVCIYIYMYVCKSHCIHQVAVLDILTNVSSDVTKEQTCSELSAYSENQVPSFVQYRSLFSVVFVA